MNPVLLSRLQINDQRWNELIERSEQKIIYGFSWYLDIVCEDWNALVWPSADDLQIVMPLPVIKKWSYSVIQQPLFCQYLGLFSRTELTAEQIILFLTTLSSNFSYISTYSFHPQNFKILQSELPQFAELKFEKNHTNWLFTNKPFELIRSKYSKNGRLNLKKAERFNWVLEKSEDILPMINLFKKYHEHKIEHGVTEKAYNLLVVLFKKLQEMKCAEVWYVSVKNKIHAGALFVKKDDMGIYLFNASDEVGRKGNGRTYLIDQYFKENNENVVWFDFESPEIESISNFYKSFGGKATPFITIQKNELPFPLKQIQRFRKKLLLKTRQYLSAIL